MQTLLPPKADVVGARSRSRQPGAGLCKAVLIVVLSLGLGAMLAACGDDGSDSAEVELSADGEAGLAAFNNNGCMSCHSVDGSRSMGPSLAGLAGTEIAIEGEGTVLADEAYLRRSIVDPRAQVRQGFASIMPVSYAELPAEELDSIVTYLTEIGVTAQP